jgi:hypothetical protein
MASENSCDCIIIQNETIQNETIEFLNKYEKKKTMQEINNNTTEHLEDYLNWITRMLEAINDQTKLFQRSTSIDTRTKKILLHNNDSLTRKLKEKYTIVLQKVIASSEGTHSSKNKKTMSKTDFETTLKSIGSNSTDDVVVLKLTRENMEKHLIAPKNELKHITNDEKLEDAAIKEYRYLVKKKKEALKPFLDSLIKFDLDFETYDPIDVVN